MCNILITAPSLDESINISGISSLTKTIITENSAHHRYYHFRLGKKDSESKDLKWLKNQITLAPRFLLFTLRNKIDFIHLNTDLTPMSVMRDFPLAMISGYFLRRKVLLHLHGGYMLMKPPGRRSPFYWMIRAMLKSAVTRIVLSEVEEQKIRKHYGLGCVKMPNAVQIKGEAQLKDFSGKLTLIFMGRIVRSKGIFLIADCMSRLSAYHRDFNLQIYGDGPDLREFLAVLDSIQGLDYSYCGIVRGDEKETALNNGHIFLLPSLFGEGLPIAMLESMNQGCVPVVSDDASIGTVVHDGHNGYLVPRNNLDKLTEKLLRALSNRSELSELSHKAKETISTHYNLEHYLSSLNKLYKSIYRDEGSKLFRNRHESDYVPRAVQED